jgi:hypothetical protein
MKQNSTSARKVGVLMWIGQAGGSKPRNGAGLASVDELVQEASRWIEESMSGISEASCSALRSLLLGSIRAGWSAMPRSAFFMGLQPSGAAGGLEQPDEQACHESPIQSPDSVKSVGGV